MGLRAAQYAAAAVALGLPAFMLYGGRVFGGSRRAGRVRPWAGARRC